MSLTDHAEIPYHLAFPLPYRTFLLIGLGILGWATNLHGLDAAGVDAVAAMDLRTGTNSSKQMMPVHYSASFNHSKSIALYNTVYCLLFLYSAFCFLSWSFFRLVTHGDATLVDYYGYIPLITAITIFLILVCPYNILLKTEREKFTLAVRRCVFPPSSGPIYFSDVILADVGTSFAKVFGELWLDLWMLKPGNSILAPPLDDTWTRWIYPAVTSFPFFLRFRQCLIEYNVSSNDNQRPLFNALKYATSFPVIILSAAQRIVVTGLNGQTAPGETWHGEHPLFRMWFLAVVINSLFSFWWDVTNDWGLDLLRFDTLKNHERQPLRPSSITQLHSVTPLLKRSSSDSLSLEEKDHPMHVTQIPKFRHRQSCVGLRGTLLYPRAIYPALIFLNLLLRMSWSVKLSTHMYSTRDGSVGFFWLQVAELVRRWLWVFIRVEWEVVKKVQEQERVPPTQLEDRSGNESDYEMIIAIPDTSTRS